MPDVPSLPTALGLLTRSAAFVAVATLVILAPAAAGKDLQQLGATQKAEPPATASPSAGAVAAQRVLDRPAAAPDIRDSAINLRRTVTVEVVEKTKDAVVYISTTKIVERHQSPFGDDPFFQFFDRQDVVRLPANSLGSGFIVHRDGYVVTNNHVIDRARQITVELSDGRKLPADLISSDADADLAILKINSDEPLPALELGDSSDLMIGEPVIAVGNPLGYSHSVSTGIVSAVHRDLKDNAGHSTLKDLIQTDAAINPGNSGGPLLNAYGQVIGINTAIRGDAQNIGFSIQVNRLRDLIPDLMNPATATKVNIPIRLMEHRVLTPPAGVRTTVHLSAKNLPPAIETIDGRKPIDLIDAYAMLLNIRPEQKRITLRFVDGKEAHYDVAAVPAPDAVVESRGKLGLTVEPMTPIMAEKYHVQTEDGLFVSEVAKGSVGAKAGIEPGDVIVQLGRYRVNNLKDFGTLIRRLPESGKVRIGVVRGDTLGYTFLEF